MSKNTHFSGGEFARRLTRLRERMAEERLDAMLLFAPESQYWLCGHDTFGYCFFQCLVVPSGDAPLGDLTLLTRSADRLQAAFTSILADAQIRIWKDGADSDPTADLQTLLAELRLKGKRIGVELDTHGLTALNYRRLEARFGGWASLIDASDLVSKLRLVKSAAEIAYIREAAAIGDASFEAALPLVEAGADEALILAALQGENFARGGDYPANEVIVGSGPAEPGAVNGGLLCRYYTGRRALAAGDQLTLEWAGVYRHYHAALMRTLTIGPASDAHKRMFDAARAALLACEAALAPGAAMGAVFQAHVDALEAHGFGHARLNACGYALGARFSPSWMEREMFYENAPTVIAPDMVFFLHMILMDATTGAAMTLGRTSLVTAAGAEPLSALPLELVER